ncbi:MAG: OmpA family protein [Phycisphaerae bacterium]|nr:OmpA family protein [Phycisphaerae bacterium]
MNRAILMVLSLAGLASLTTGCVTRSEYDKLHAAYQTCEGERTEMRNRLAAIEAQLKAVTDERDALRLSGPEQVKAMSAQLDKLNVAYADLLAKYQDALKAGGGVKIDLGGPLPAELNAALKKFAQENGLEYDESRGVVRFSNDLTFAKGSFDLTPDARKQLAAFANIINMKAADKFDVLVVGHTDGIPIAKPETKAKTPTNWHLSTYRAVEVLLALDSAKVAPTRLGALGFGEMRPRPGTTNPRTGTPQNRRVEVYLVAKNAMSVGELSPLIIPGTAILAGSN